MQYPQIVERTHQGTCSACDSDCAVFTIRISGGETASTYDEEICTDCLDELLSEEKPTWNGEGPEFPPAPLTREQILELRAENPEEDLL